MDIIKNKTTDNLYICTEALKYPKTFPVFNAHEALEIYIVCEGERKMYLGNTLYSVSAGDAAMISANLPHRSYGTIPYRGVCIHLPEVYIRKSFTPKIGSDIMECFQKPIISLSNEACDMVWSIASDIENNSIDKNEGFLKIIQILKSFLSISDPNSKLCFDSDLSNIGAYIQKNYMTIKSLDDLTEHFNITKSYLCRIFKKQTGITVTNYINSLRMQYACKLLYETDLKIDTISKNCGYDTIQYFNRIFKQIKGDTPLNVRKKSRRNKMFVYEEDSTI